MQDVIKTIKELECLPNSPHFIRRADLTPSVRLQIAFKAFMARQFKCWGVITGLSEEYAISRTFIYMLAAQLEQANEVIFGCPAFKNKEPDLEAFKWMLSLRLEGRCSIGGISTIMQRFDTGLSSSGSISQYFSYFGSIVDNTLKNVNTEIQIPVFASDEIFAKSLPILVTVDPISSAILKIELSDTRKASDWITHWDSLINNGFYPKYLVCDQGSGLCTAKKELLPDVIMQTDTYHAIAHLLGQWVNRFEAAAGKAIEAEDQCWKNLDSACSDRVINTRIDKFEKAQKNSEEKIELYESFRYLYHSIIGELRIFNSTGGLREIKTAVENISAGLDLIETLNNNKLNASVKKVRRALPQLLNYFDVAHEVVGTLKQQDIDDNVLLALCLAWQWNKGVIKAKKSDRKRYCSEKEYDFLETAELYHTANVNNTDFDHIKEQVYQALDHIVQSSAMVECINSIIRPYLNSSKNHITQGLLNLIMFYHNHRRYHDGKRQGSTPMELLTGQKQEKDWIELLFEQVRQKDPQFFQRR